MSRNMGWDFGLEKGGICFKRKFRWLLRVPEVSADGIRSLPPQKSARPSISFKEIEVQHLNETIYYPGRPEWKPITLVLYDLKFSENPVFTWLKKVYDPCEGRWQSVLADQFKKKIQLELYDGCGNTIEKWIYENAWPNAIEWGELDMGNNEYTTMDLTLRYDRAFIEDQC